MSGRRPVWLTEEAWDRISDVLKGNGFGYGDHAVDEFWDAPEPWLTVDDHGNTVRMVPTTFANRSKVGPTAYHAVPVGEGE